MVSSPRSSRSRSRAPGTAGAEFLPGAELVSVSPERQEQADADTARRRHLAGRTLRRVPDQRPQPVSGGLSGPARTVPSRAASSAATSSRARSSWSRSATCSTSGTDSAGPARSAEPVDQRQTAATCPSRPRDQLVAADINTRIDVYVRDMDEPIDSPAAFELVSARDGGDQPATYGGSLTAVTGAQVGRRGGAERGRPQGRVRHAGAVGPARRRARHRLPPGQLFVRDLDAAHHDARDAQQGGRHAGRRGATSAGTLATISADGSTVAWTGQNAALQTRTAARRDRQPRPTTCGAASRTGPPPPPAASPALRTSTIPAAPSRITGSTTRTPSGPVLRTARQPGGLAAGSARRASCRRSARTGRKVAFLVNSSRCAARRSATSSTCS